MKNETLYNKTIDILVQAYFNDELTKNSCETCAVGNIIKACTNDRYVWLNWWEVFYTAFGVQEINLSALNKRLSDGFNKTGYSLIELVYIEYAFETANKFDYAEFNGLMAVVTALDIIHENTNIEITEQTKRKFYGKAKNGAQDSV